MFGLQRLPRAGPEGEAVDAHDNLNRALGYQAGALLGERLDYVKGVAVLKKCPLAKWWSGGYW